MAVIEKTYRGTATRVVASVVAAMLAVWVASFLYREEMPSARKYLLGIPYVIGFAALGWWRWRLLVDLMILNLPLWIIFPMMVLRVPNFSLVEMALVAGAVGGAIRVAERGELRWYSTPVTPYMVLLVLAALCSSLLFFIRWFLVLDTVFLRVLIRWLPQIPAMDSFSTFYPLRASLTLIEGFVFFHVIVARARELRAVRSLVEISLLSALLVSLGGAYQYFTGWNRVDFDPWGHRINATFPDVNSLASFLVANLFLLISLLTLEKGRRRRALAMVVLPVLALAFYMAHSRAAYAALLLTLPLYALLRSERIAFERPVVWLYKKRRFLTTVFTLGLITLGCVFIGLDYESHTDLRWTRSTGPIARTLKGRLNIWRSAFYTIAEVPWFGRGIGTFNMFLVWHWEPLKDVEEWNWNPVFENAHNQFLQMFTEMGMIGGGLLLLILGAVLYQGLRAIVIHRGEDRALPRGVLCGLVVFLLTCMTGHPLVLVDVNLWFWFLAALLFVPVESESAGFARQQATRRGFRRFVLAVLLVAVGFRWVEALEPRPPATIGYGLYGVEYMDPNREYSFFWARKEVVYRLYQVYPELRFCLRRPDGMQGPLTVTIRVNDQEIDRVRLDDAEWHVCSYPTTETARTAIKLELLSDNECKPPHERRRLAVQVQSLIENAWWRE